MGETFRLVLKYDRGESGAPGSVIAKIARDAMPPITNPLGRLLATIYERETLFYRDLAEDCGLRTPRTFLSTYDANTGQFVILLEDLGHLRMIDQAEDLGLEDAKSALNAIAGMHARWWGDERLSIYQWLRDHGTTPADGTVMREIATANLDMFLDVCGENVPAGLENLVREALPAIPEISDELARAPVTLVQGDFRLSNLFFDDSDDATGPIVAIDWQSAGRVRSADDIAQFMYTSFGVENRRKHETELLTEYHTALTDGGVRGYSSHQFEDDIRRGLLTNLCKRLATAGTLAALPASDNVRRQGAAMFERLQMLVDWNCEEVIP